MTPNPLATSPSPAAPLEGPDKTSLLFAAVIPLLSLLDMVVLPRWTPAILGIRLLWGLELVVFAFVVNRTTGRARSLLLLFNGALGSAMVLALVGVTGVLDSPYVYLVPCLPLLVAFIYPEEAGSAIGSGIVCMLGLGTLVWFTGHPTSQAIRWAALVALMSFFGVAGSSQFRRSLAASNEAQLERTRREAAEKFARTLRDQAQSERLATVGRLAAGVLHEINNPLAFVNSNLRFLTEELRASRLSAEERAGMEEALQETREGVERMQQIVQDLKGFARRDTEEVLACALTDVVADAVRLAAVRLKHVARVTVQLPPELPLVHATPRRLVQVLLNLLVNAGDSIEEKGEVPGTILVRGELRADHVVLCVEDSGRGFPPEVLPHLFETFFTTKGPDKGTGLGLVISRELLEHCGARLAAENRVEGGARLRIEWPLSLTGPRNEAPG